MIGWGRKRSQWWVVILLPGFLLRALIPTGFMPMFGPAFRVQIMLCEGFAPIPATVVDMSIGMPMDMPMGVPAHHRAGGDPSSNGSRSPFHQDHSACPYGASPALAALPVLTSWPLTAQRSPEPPASTPQVAHFEISPRAQSPRGPPAKV